jgi:hypothetical protein
MHLLPRTSKMLRSRLFVQIYLRRARDSRDEGLRLDLRLTIVVGWRPWQSRATFEATPGGEKSIRAREESFICGVSLKLLRKPSQRDQFAQEIDQWPRHVHALIVLTVCSESIGLVCQLAKPRFALKWRHAGAVD